MSTDQQRILTCFPAGSSNGEFNLPSEFVTAIQKGNGCELWDIHGRRFLDFSMGWGSVLVGHAHPQVVDAVKRQCELGSNFAFVNENALLLAEELIRLSPACEQVRFCASGTEATLYCVRLARAYRRRPKMLKFEGAYHGAHDLGAASLFPVSAPNYPHADPTCSGGDPEQTKNVLIAPFNDLEAVTRIVEQNKDDLAGVIVEPLQRCTSPEPGFLQGLRDLTKKHEILLLFDEVVTGFRLAYGGAQTYYGVTPDLIAYGKALGGGYPIGVYGGRREIMRIVCEDRMHVDTYVWSASTLGGNPVSTAAARAALSILSQEGVYERLHELGRYLRSGMETVLNELGITGSIIGDGPLAQSIFTDRTVRDYRSAQHQDSAFARRVSLGLFERGIFLNPMGTKLYLSIAHDESICDAFLDRFEDTLRALR